MYYCGCGANGWRELYWKYLWFVFSDSFMFILLSQPVSRPIEAQHLVKSYKNLMLYL